MRWAYGRPGAAPDRPSGVDVRAPARARTGGRCAAPRQARGRTRRAGAGQAPVGAPRGSVGRPRTRHRPRRQGAGGRVCQRAGARPRRRPAWPRHGRRGGERPRARADGRGLAPGERARRRGRARQHPGGRAGVRGGLQHRQRDLRGRRRASRAAGPRAWTHGHRDPRGRHVRLDQPARHRRRRVAVVGRPAGDRADTRRARVGQRRGACDGGGRLRHGARDPEDHLRSRWRWGGHPREQHRCAGGRRREGDHGRHLLPEPAVLPGRHRRAGGRPREGERRGLPGVGRQPRAAELGGRVHAGGAG